MKKGPLSKKEKAYIAENIETSTATLIADHLDRSVHMVDKYVATLKTKASETQVVSNVEPTETTAPTSEPNPLYARNVADNGVVRSTIGTQAASMAADESRAKRKEDKNGVSPRMNKHIHVIKRK